MRFFLLFALVAVVVLAIRTIFRSATRRDLPVAEAARRIAAGQAVLIDVREPAEWRAGVASPAYLCPLSDLRESRRKWRHILADLRGKQALLYCASGARSTLAARALRAEGIDALNLGTYRDWHTAGLPTRAPDDPATLS
jgi:rhodanese-related sulfurtransferase